MKRQITENIGTPTILDSDSPKTGRLRIGIISPGWGSSGYYSDQVLHNATEAGVWRRGTQMFLDHPSESERRDRPERSVRDLAATAVTDAEWDDDFGGPVFEAQAHGAYRDLLADETFLESIGVSIRATGDFTIGEADGRRGQLITELYECQSVDFVTKAGRGGKVLSLLESARQPVSEATTDDMRDQLQRQIVSTYGGPGRYTWLRDFDPDRAVAWFSVEGEGEPYRLLEQPYTDTDGALTLTGTPVEVRSVTTYQPLTAATPATEAAHTSPHDPVIPAGTTTTSQEDTMPQIEEAHLRQLEEAAGRVTEAETAAQSALERAERAEQQLAMAARARNTGRAVELLHEAAAEARVQFTALEARGFAIDYATTDDLDETQVREAARAASAEKASAAGAGRVHGFGGTPVSESAKPITWDDIDAEFGITKEA